MRSSGKMLARGLGRWEGEGHLPPPRGCACPGVTAAAPARAPSVQSEGENKDHPSSSPRPLPPQSARRGVVWRAHSPAALPDLSPQGTPPALPRGPVLPTARGADKHNASLQQLRALLFVLSIRGFPCLEHLQGWHQPPLSSPQPLQGPSGGGSAGGDRLGGPAGTTGDLAGCACRGRMCTAFSRSFGVEGAVGMMMGIMASCFLSMGRWLLCALVEGDCRRGNVPLPPSF